MGVFAAKGACCLWANPDAMPRQTGFFLKVSQEEGCQQYLSLDYPTLQL